MLLRIAVFCVCALLSSVVCAQWQTTRVYRGTGAPASGQCAGQADVGIFYTDRSAGGSTYKCARAVGGTFVWTVVGGAASSTDLSDSGGLVRGAAGLITNNKLVEVSATDGTVQEVSNQTANTVLAGPASGSAAAPSFRAPVVADLPTAVSYWRGPYTVLKVANGVGGCADAGGCWTVNGGTAVVAEADDSQDIVVATVPASHVTDFMLGTAENVTACTGADSIVAYSLTFPGGNVSTFYYPSTEGNLDLTAAPSDTTVANAGNFYGRRTKAAGDAAVTVTVTGEAKTIQSIAAGCSFRVWLSYAVLP